MHAFLTAILELQRAYPFDYSLKKIMSQFDQAIQQLPQPILDKLQALIQRVRRLLLIRGLAATLAVGLVAVLVIMAIDASVMIFSRTVRWTLSLMGLGVTLIAAWCFLIRPLSKKITLTHIARFLEIKHPELQERISTAVELMASDDPDSVRGSEELITAVVDSAVIDVETVNPETEFEPIRSNRFVKAVVAALVLILVLFAIWPRQIGVLFSRAVAPFLDVGNAWAETIEVDPGDIRVAVGDSITVTMTVDQKRLRRADLRRTQPDGTESVERMTLMGDDEQGRKRFSITFPGVSDSFEYRVAAGSAVSEFYDVTAVQRPEIEQLTVSYDYPRYTQLERKEGPIESGEIRAVVHTEVTLTAKLNKPISEAGVTINGQQAIEPEELAEGGQPELVTWKFEMKPRMNGSWTLDLKDEDGFENQSPNFTIAALPDRSPIVSIEAPVSRELRLKPTEILPIRYVAKEDFGFSEIVLMATPNGEQLPSLLLQPTPEPVVGALETWGGVANLNLAELDLKGHSQVSVQVRASDNLPEMFDGANQGLSETITIIIDRNAKSLTQQTIDKDKKELQKALSEARQELERAKKDTHEAEQQLAREETVNDKAKKDLQEFHEHAKTAQEKLREVAEKLENSVFNQQADKMENVADEEVADAREKAEMIPVTDEKAERVAEAREMRKDVEEAIKDLQEIERSINETAKEAQMLAELNDLANEQRELAQKAEQQSEEANAQRQKQKMDEWQREQQKVQKELGDFLEENKAALATVLEQQQAEAQKLAEQTQQLAEEQKNMQELTQQASQADQQEALKNALLAALKKEQEQIAQDTQSLQKSEQQQAQDQQTANQGKSENSPEMAKNESADSPPASESEEASVPSSPELAKNENQSQERAMEQAQAAQKATVESLAEASEQTQQAAEQTAQASEEASAENIESAVEKAQQASEALAEAAQSAQKAAAAQAGSPSARPPSQPSSPEQPSASQEASQSGELAEAQAAEAAAEASELADRQEAVAEQLAAVASGDIEAALAMREEQIQAEASQLQTAAEAVEQAAATAQQAAAQSQADRAENSLEQAMSQANQAQNRLTQAQQAQAQAEAKGQPANQPTKQAQQQLAQSQQNQQKAAQMMQQAAQSLQETAKALAQQSQQASEQAAQQASEQADSPFQDGQQLAESFQEVSEAASAQTSQEASQQAQQAAQSLQQLAQQAMQQMGMGQQQPGKGQQPPGQPGEPSQVAQNGEISSDALNETGKKAADANGDGIPPELEALGLTAAEWAKMRGVLTSGSTASGPDEVSPEYRELVGRYFRVIASEAGE